MLQSKHARTADNAAGSSMFSTFTAPSKWKAARCVKPRFILSLLPCAVRSQPTLALRVPTRHRFVPRHCSRTITRA